MLQEKFRKAVSCKSNTISLNKQDIGHVTELGINRYIDMGGDRKHLPLRDHQITGSGISDRFELMSDTENVLCRKVTDIALEICFGFELFQLLPRIGREIISYAKQIPEVI